MGERILITGGAGFIGRRLARHLLGAGDEVRILDVLLPQVHGNSPALPRWLEQDCELQVASVLDRDAVAAAVKGIDAVVHLAAETGTAQSMYAIHRCTDVNVSGTALLLECLVPHLERIRSVIVASSRAVYGEGKYDCARCGIVYPTGRTREALAAGRWEPVCPQCGGDVTSLPTDEASLTRPTSTYGVTKLSQELLLAAFGPAFDVAVAALRYQNVYGGGQSLGNPYTGILTHFFTAVRRQEPPRVFEDGFESRDFVHVDDVVNATVRAIRASARGTFNVGSGVRTTIWTLAELMCRTLGGDLRPQVVSEYRVGDIRHCVADLRRAAAALGYEPQVTLEAGMREFVEWAIAQPDTGVPVANANRELAAFGLLKVRDGT
jgi:dTDP-L-rhamnose 4-epimerase